MSELKPCPFCGSEADLNWGGATDIGGALHQNGWVCCTNPDCDATVDVDSINDSKSDIDLINKWNTRAETETEERLTVIATKHATRADELYEALETVLLVLEGKTEFSPDEISTEGLREILDKTQIEQETKQ